MKFVLRSLFIFILAFFFLLAFPSDTAYSGYTYCDTADDGTEKCYTKAIEVDIKVKNPATGIFVDKLSENDPRYNPRNVVEYKISVKNTGNVDLSAIAGWGYPPSRTSFVSGSGTWKDPSHQYVFSVDSLSPGSTYEDILQMRIYDNEAIDLASICDFSATMQVTALGAGDSMDSTNFCVEKIEPTAVPTAVPTATPTRMPPVPSVTLKPKAKVVVSPTIRPVKQQPKTGPGAVLLILPGLFIGGVFVLRKSYS